MSLSKIPVNGRVAVIGSGISGLSFTYFLNALRPDIKITIYESRKEAGGWIQSKWLKDQKGQSLLLEKGPRTLRGVREGTLLIIDILKRLKLEDQIQVMAQDSIANRKYLLSKENKVVELPRSFWTQIEFFKSGIVNLGSIVPGLLLEGFNKTRMTGDESIDAFMKRRFRTKTLTENLISGMVHGIYAGDTAQLSMKSIFPGLVDLEQEFGSVTKGMVKKWQKKLVKDKVSDDLRQYEAKVSPNANLEKLSLELKQFPMIKLKDGLQILPDSMALYLSKQDGITFRYGTPVDGIDLERRTVSANGEENAFNHIRSTINVNHLGNLVKNEEIKSLLKLEYISIFLANIYSPSGSLIPKGKEGFGFLVPKNNPNHESLLGVIYDSTIEQHVQSLATKKPSGDTNNDYDKITLMMGGHFYNKLGIPSNSINERAIKNTLLSLMNVDLKNHNIKIDPGSNLAQNAQDQVVELQDNDLLVSYNLQKDCIPQYTVGYEGKKLALLSKLSFEYNNTFSLGGMAFAGGIGVPDCVSNALQDAMKAA